MIKIILAYFVIGSCVLGLMHNYKDVLIKSSMRLISKGIVASLIALLVISIIVEVF